MFRFERVIILEVEKAKDKHAETPGGKYRRDTPWLSEAFKKKGLKSEIVFITGKDTADSLAKKYSNTAFLGRMNPVDYPDISLNEYVKILGHLQKKGLLLGPVPEQMDRLGSKIILYELRHSTMGVSGIKLHTLKDMKANQGELDKILPKNGPPRVLKMMRGCSGLGVWKLKNKGDNVLLTDAYTHTTVELARNKVLPRFLELSSEDAISMPFLPMIKEGEYRFLLSKHKVLAVVHKRPVDESGFTATLRSGALYNILSLEEHKSMVNAVQKWTEDIKGITKLDDVPYWWSVDCIEKDLDSWPNSIPSSNPGRRLVLSEINCSCLGLVADTSEEAKKMGMRFADMIADICLK